MDSASELSRLSLFVSYSREDHGFADQLVAALESWGFTTTTDRTDIHGAENWQQRLGQLILEADTVVFVLTPASAVSAVCAWEVEHALELQKRIVPVIASALGAAQPHRSLRDLDYIYFYDEPKLPGSGFGRGLARLTTALSVDVEWIRKHTRLSEYAVRWGRDRTPDVLLRGSELAAAQRWRDARPPNAPELTIQQREFLSASEDAERERTSEKRRQMEERQRILNRMEAAQAERAAAQAERATALDNLSRRTRYGLVGIAALALLSVLAALVAWRQNDELQGASLRLREGMRLRIADTERVVETTEKWYRIATDYKLALGVLRTPKPRIGGSGFLVEGGSLRPEWSGRAVFLTTSHNLPPPEDLSDSYIVFPGIDETSRFRVDTALFESPREDLDVAVLGLVQSPRRAVPVVLGAEQGMRQALDGVAVLQWTSRDGFAMGFGHTVAVPDGGPWPDRIYYTYMTGPGASGAPVFDADSGTVACLHIGALREPVLRVAYCTPIAGILAAIAG